MSVPRIRAPVVTTRSTATQNFVFAVLLYNIWRLTDFLLKAGVEGEMDYAPVLTAGECVELVASALIPHD